MTLQETITDDVRLVRTGAERVRTVYERHEARIVSLALTALDAGDRSTVERARQAQHDRGALTEMLERIRSQ